MEDLVTSEVHLIAHRIDRFAIYLGDGSHAYVYMTLELGDRLDESDTWLSFIAAVEALAEGGEAEGPTNRELETALIPLLYERLQPEDRAKFNTSKAFRDQIRRVSVEFLRADDAPDPHLDPPQGGDSPSI